MKQQAYAQTSEYIGQNKMAAPMTREILEVPMIGFFRDGIFVYAHTPKAAAMTDHEEDLVQMPITIRVVVEPFHMPDNLRLLPVVMNERVTRVVS